MDYANTIGQRMIAKAERHAPINAITIAECFTTHDNCTDVFPMYGWEPKGVVVRNDGYAFSIFVDYEETSSGLAYSWGRKVCHADMLEIDQRDIYMAMKADWETVAHDIAETVTNWLDGTPLSDPIVVKYDSDELDDFAEELEDSIYQVKHYIDEDEPDYVVVQFDDGLETTARIDIEDGYRYTVEYHQKDGERDTRPYTDFDSLLAELLEYGAQPRA